MRSRFQAALAFTILAGAPSAPLFGQERLLTKRSLSVAPYFESVSFGNEGLAADDGSGDATLVRVQRASQFVIPFGASLAVTDRWTVDAGGAYTSGSVRIIPATGGARDIDLSGISDIRLRLTGKVIGEGLLLSIGANIPAGPTSLTHEQLTALRVLAAPALGFQLPAVGFGPAGSIGLVATRAVGEWVAAVGASFEYRGKYSPIAALQAGAEPEFDPGNAVHGSVGFERFVGEHRFNLQLGADVYSTDRLLVGGGGGSAQDVKLGPVLSIDTGLDFATERVADARLFAAVRLRGSFQRDGVTVDGSSGTYVNAGYRGGLPIGRSSELRFAFDGLVHSGLDVDSTITTASARAAGFTLGWRQRSSSVTLDPFVRVQAGTIDSGIESRTMSGFSGGLIVAIRF